MRKFLLATTVAVVALTFSGKVFAQSGPYALLAPKVRTSPEPDRQKPGRR